MDDGSQTSKKQTAGCVMGELLINDLMLFDGLVILSPL